MSDVWSQEEAEAAVADYFVMLAKELRGDPFNKAEHNRALQHYVNRTRGSIERKHQNISAILIQAGYPYIEGYKPLGNYQELLRSVVEDRLAGAASLNATVASAVQTPAVAPVLMGDLLAMQVAPPVRDTGGARVQEQPEQSRPPVRRNYLEIEARNRSLGRAGEELILRFEHERLTRLGERRLAERIRHVSEIEGDHLGYDILSFEGDGQERLIEVKTTRFGGLTPFFASRNEVAVSEARENQYQLYRLFGFSSQPRLFSLSGALRKTCQLDPFTYSALPR